jgi:flagellar hook-associated protein 3 FlgL
MRVTSNTYTNLVINSSQDAQQRLATLQQEISTGDSVQAPSDNPVVYAEASQDQEQISQLNAYNSAITGATTATTANNSAMTSIHQLVANASELATTVTSATSASDMSSIATQIQTLITSLTSTVNQTDASGNYIFGGTVNEAPIDSTGNYNTSTNGETTSTEVENGNSVQTSIAAGHAGPPAVDGFLYDSTSGVDVLGSLKQVVSDLQSGNTTAVQSTDLTALNSALDHISMYVGSTAAQMSAVSTASKAVTAETTTKTNQLNSLTQTDLATASVQLSQIQNQYEAALEAGTKLMNISIINYLGTSTG